MYNRDPATPSQLVDNQKDSNSVLLSFSMKSVPIDQYVLQVESIYHLMLAKAHSNIKRLNVS